MAVTTFVTTCLRGAGQVMFQNNPVTGGLILAAVVWGAFAEGRPAVGAGAVVGLAVGTGAAYLLDVDPTTLRQGMYGFSPLLTGAALPTFLGNRPSTWVLLVLGAAVTTVVTLAIGNVFTTWNVPALTFPFVLTTWILTLAAYQFFRVSAGSLPVPALPATLGPDAARFGTDAGALVTAMLNGVSQVFLIGNWVSGLLILVALAVNSWWDAGLAAAAAVASTLVAIAFGADATTIGEGLWGYSAVLTAIALGCVFFRPSGRVLLYALLGTVFTVFVQAALDTVVAPYGVPTFTAAFVFATWLFLLPKRDLVPTPHHEPVPDGVLTTKGAT
jgi:urea transporter